MFYLTMHSARFIFTVIWHEGMTWIMREQIHCHQFLGHSHQLAAKNVLYAPSNRHDSTHHDLSCNSCEALAGIRNTSVG